MKIGFDSKRLFSNFTGLGNYSRSLLLNLEKYFPEGDYHLYTPKIKHSPETIPFFENPHFNVHSSNVFLKSYWRSFSIVDQLRKDNVELFHGLSNEIPFTIRKSGIKSVVTIHDLIFKMLPSTYPYIDRQIYDLKFRKSCNNADRIIAISNSTKNDIVKYYHIDPAKIEVVYQSCNPLYYDSDPITNAGEVLKQYNLPSEYLLYVGTVEPRKNLKLIVEAYSFLSEDLRIPLVVIGKGKDYMSEVKQLIHSKGLEKLVLWFDYLENNRHLQTFYHHAQAFIYPSFYEGFGLPVVEALLGKTPVITSNTSSLPEAAGPDSFCINPDNAEELAHAITKVLNDSALRKAMIHNGYGYAKDNFSPRKVTEQLHGLYQKI
jgi:glycosyltransferase involved in cell wall biosynthesis